MVTPYTSTKRFTASGDLQRKSRKTVVGGYTGVDIENKYMNYEQISLMSPHIFVPLHKVALNICKKIIVRRTYVLATDESRPKIFSET